jgi:hypothetical protein
MKFVRTWTYKEIPGQVFLTDNACSEYRQIAKQGAFILCGIKWEGAVHKRNIFNEIIALLLKFQLTWQVKNRS